MILTMIILVPFKEFKVFRRIISTKSVTTVLMV